MSIYGRPLRRANRWERPQREFSLRLAGLALFLSVVVCALVVDRAGVLGALQRAGAIIENGLRLIGSVDAPF
jgi:hypothetical protein